MPKPDPPIHTTADVPGDLYALTDLPTRPWMPRLRRRPLNKFTAIRWALHGRKGRKLRTLMVGGIRCTCDAWAVAFFEALTAGDDVPKPPNDRRRQGDHRDAEAELDRAGIR